MMTDDPVLTEAVDAASGGVPREPHLLYHGSPSQAVNTPALVMVLLIIAGVWWSRVALGAPTYLMAAVVGVALAYLAVKYLHVARTVFTIDDERIHVGTGVFDRRITSLEVFRIRDVALLQPWWQGLLGVATVRVDSNDLDTPCLRLVGMERAHALQDRLSKAAVRRRRELGIHEVDMVR